MSTFTPLSAVSLYQPLHHCQIIVWYQCQCPHLYTTVSSVTVSTITSLSDNYMVPVSPLHQCQQCHCINLYTTVSSVTVSTFTPLLAVSLYRPQASHKPTWLILQHFVAEKPKTVLKICREAFSVQGVSRRISVQ